LPAGEPLRLATLSLAALLALGGLAFLAAPASAGPSCGPSDEHLNLVDTWVWYGSGGCYGAVVVWLPPELCPSDMFGVDRPYASVLVNACAGVVLLQP
jgi:hypothetical protein